MTDGLPSGVVTFLFSDIEGSTRLLSRIGDDDYWPLVERQRGLLRSCFDRHHGHEVGTDGDSFFVTFARATDAASAALEAQIALAREVWPHDASIRVRMGLHTGEAVVVGADYYGLAIHQAARIAAAGHGGQILVSGATAALVHDILPAGAQLENLGSHRLKDLDAPQQIFQLGHANLDSSFPPLKTLELRAHNLPVQLTSFVGREAELAELVALVRETRIVSLVGAGGVGKTRLALQTAAEVVTDYPDGVWLLELAPLASQELVIDHLARVLAVGDGEGSEDAIDNRLSGRRLLLLFDNCEHLVDGVAKLTERIVRRHPGTSVIATSREPLGIAGERTWRVPPLPERDAAQLFIDRAGTTDDIAAIEAICLRLDGIPLAVELAAARAQTMTPAQIADRLANRFDLLTTGDRSALPRQQTLRATVDWSYALLSDVERAVFRRLCVFAGTFDLIAAEHVASSDRINEFGVDDSLASLVQRSLVTFDRERGRYTLLETLREYGGEKLTESGDDVAARDRHLEHFTRLAESAYAARAEAEEEWAARLEADHDNFRAALDWAHLQGDGAELALAGLLGWFWQLRSHYRAGRERLEAALSGRTGVTPERARALWALGLLAGMLGDDDAAEGPAEESLAIWREVGDEDEVASALESQGWGAIVAGRDLEMLAKFEEARAIRGRRGSARLMNWAEIEVCQALVALGRVDEAEERVLAALPLTLEHSEPKPIHLAHHLLGDCALIRGDVVEAERRYMISGQAVLSLGDEFETAMEVDAVSMAVAGQGRHRKAVILHSAAETKLAALGADISRVAFWMALQRRFLDPARDALGSAAADEAAAMGGAMDFADAVAYALDAGRD